MCYPSLLAKVEDMLYAFIWGTVTQMYIYVNFHPAVQSRLECFTVYKLYLNFKKKRNASLN